VADNVGVVPKLLGWSRRRVRERVDELLDLVELEPVEFRGRYPRSSPAGSASGWVWPAPWAVTRP
jgi:osmoprotectant transport system ATP-binding protein